VDNIAERVRNMAEASKALLGLSADEEDSFFLQMEGRFTGILKAFGSCAAAEAEIHTTLAELEEAVRSMRKSVAEVREIEISIHRIAINATIRAVQIGDSGNALLVLADVMQRLALDSNNIVEEVAGSLDAISDAANGLSSGSTGSDAEDVVSETRATILELHSSSEAGFCRLNEIAALSSRLGDEVRSARAGFSAGTLFAEAVKRARHALAQIGGQAGLTGLGDMEIAAQRRLEEAATHYTMQAERAVHESVARGAARDRGAPASPSRAVSGEEELGENVELF
jgi:hypothetical protein